LLQQSTESIIAKVDKELESRHGTGVISGELGSLGALGRTRAVPIRAGLVPLMQNHKKRIVPRKYKLNYTARIFLIE
jgi:hypothetical protein